MGQALYRKYRSKKLGEIVGQEHITETLDKALKAGKISHAYLFTGPRGVGKTSIARILAHEINGLDYTKGENHLDIIEIDAASNRRIDEIRELRDKVAIAPSSAQYKVYIIDEVHMLTKEAFNALLKTLEEPPAHVIFILATTDAHKLPETIISRTQRYSFKPVAMPKVVEHLKSIAASEGITIDDDAAQLLAEHGEGSFRDSISMLDQAGSGAKHINKGVIEALLGVPADSAILALVDNLASGSSKAAMGSLNQLFEQGFQAAGIASAVAKLVRKQLIDDSSAISSDKALALLEELLEVPAAHNSEGRLELAILKAVGGHTAHAQPVVAKIEPLPVQAAPVHTPAPKAPQPSEKPPSKPAAVATPAPEPPKPVKKPGNAAFDAEIWPQLLARLKQNYNTLYGVVRMASPQFGDGELHLAFTFVFHQKRINDPKNKKVIADIMHELTGQNVIIECSVDKQAKPGPVAAAASTADVGAISDIFGGGQVL